MSNNRSSNSSSTTVLVVVGVGVLVLIVFLFAVIVSNASDDASDEAAQAGLEQQRPVSVEGAHLPVLETGNDPALNTMIPAVQGETFAGEPIAVAPDGVPKVVMFLAHWCPHCQAEVPRVVDWLDGADSVDGVQFVGVSTSTDESAPNYPPSSWLADEGWPVPTMADDPGNHAAEAMGLSAFPYYVAVDANGAVAARTSGELTVEEIEGLVAAAAR